ncbi:hypothetical protein EVG20_g3932 [Dentipellis fragilis]|uniref:DUF2461 domain-containing protein n=1 Tax=Dentipellis fragilis TaxID=205917 RepID=A0A4Y9YYY2_9AGAM|nr:hypothetical protein EVG20_g3932 [Dentipellis fragilis]
MWWQPLAIDCMSAAAIRTRSMNCADILMDVARDWTGMLAKGRMVDAQWRGGEESRTKSTVVATATKLKASACGTRRSGTDKIRFIHLILSHAREAHQYKQLTSVGARRGGGFNSISNPLDTYTFTTPEMASTRSKPKFTPAKAKANAKAKPATRKRARAARDATPSESEGDASDAYEESADATEDEEEALNSDALDDDEDFGGANKRKRKAGTKTRSPKDKKARAPAHKRRRKAYSEDEKDDEIELEEGQEVVGVVVQAPKTGRVPPGQVSQNTLNFLSELKNPEHNDREWFKLHEPVYRLAEKEWKDFVDKFTDALTEVDPQIPPLPPKDVIHRIYRDIRFSNDKTPYKTGFSASFSRSGRKGIFAAYHIAIKSGNESLIAAGSWCPGKNELATIRAHIGHNSSRLRAILSEPTFVSYFGKPKPGKRQSIFGMEDELKVAPKGVDKNHKDIDLLKCRSFAVVHRFTDEVVLRPDFMGELMKVVEAAKPLVYCLNDYMTLNIGDGEEGQDEADEADEGEE